jgi:hypothetical protein
VTSGADPSAWRTCSVCGGAVPAGPSDCPTCGQRKTVPTAAIGSLPRRQRRRVRATQIFRSLIVVAVVVGIAYAILSAVLAGPPVYSDPLTTKGTYSVAPGNYTVLSGWITGEDYVDGNFTILDPVGTTLVFQVFNSTGFAAWVHHQPATPQWTTNGTGSGAIVFAAPYTDLFYLVFENPYEPTSGIQETIYIATNYQSNVVIG